MKEPKHNIAYFLTNPNFIAWVKKPNVNSDNFWRKWLKNHPVERQAFYNAKAVLERTNFKESTSSNCRKEEILENILNNNPSPHYEETFSFGKKYVKRIPWFISTAAAIFLLIIASNFFFNNYYGRGMDLLPPSYMVAKKTNTGEKTTFYLPDSSRVTLNAESSLSYPRQFEGETREVTLIGEAYFDVKHDSDHIFIVNSGDIVTSVYGTTFNVNAYSDSPIRISLEHGSVSISSGLTDTEREVFKMIPGEKLIVNEEFAKSIKSVYDFEEEFGWKDKILVFKNADLKTFVSKLERWYGININVVGKSDANWAINGRFKDQSLKDVLTSLAFSRDIAYKIEENQVTLYQFNN